MIWLAFVSGAVLGIAAFVLVTGLLRMRRRPSSPVISIIPALVVFFLLIGFPDGSACLALASTRVYLVGGQSRASGVVPSSELTDSEAVIPANVEYWSNVTGLPGQHQLLSSYRDLPKFGPEVKLIKLLANHYPGQRIIVIKVAKGGTNMGHWISGGTMHTLFFETVQAILANEDPYFCNLFWSQGEQDMVTEIREELYESRTISFFADARAEFRADLIINMVLADAPVEDYPYQYGVANGQQRIAKNDPFTRAVTSQGLSKYPDGVHDDKAGTMELGRRMYVTAMGN